MGDEYSFNQAYKQAFPSQPATPPTNWKQVDQATGAPTATSTPTNWAAINAAAGMQSVDGLRKWDHYGDFNFVIEIDGLDVGAFQKCEGLSFECDPIEYKDSLDTYMKYRPGIRRFGKIKLTKGVVDSDVLWQWCNKVFQGRIDRRHGAIHVYGDDGSTELVTYRFLDALPTHWSGLRLDGKGNSSLIEELEIAPEIVMREAH